MPNRLLWSSAILLLPLGLGGCLSSSESSTSAPNSFPPLENDFSENSSGDTANTCSKLAANELCVTVEVPRSLAGDSATSTRRNLYVVRPSSVEVKRIDGSQEIETLAIERRRDNSGSMIVTLSGYETMPTDPDLILIARLSDGTVVRGPLADADQDVKLNPFSEYLVSEVLVDGQLSREQIAAVKTCGAVCLAKLVWPTLADHIQDFEISIPPQMGMAEAVAYLSGRVDMTGYVDSMVATMTPGSTDNNVTEGETVNFNTVYFGLELNRRVLESGETAGQWGTRVSTTESNTNNAGTAEFYPSLTLATFVALGLEVNSSAGRVPFNRDTVLYPEVPGFTAPDWQPNSHDFAPGSGLIQGDYFRTGRSPYQQVTEESGRIWGWASNPYFFDGYLLGEGEITGLLGSYFHSGKAIELEHNEGNRFDRLGTLEDLAVGAIEVNIKQLSVDEDDNPGPLNFTSFGGGYTAVSFGVELGDDLAPVEAHVQVQGYTASAGPERLDLNVAVPAFGADWVLKRESDGGVIPTADPGSGFGTITVLNSTDELYRNGEFEDAFYGRITVEDSLNGPGLGSAGEKGEVLAYTYQGTNGRGITIIGRSDADATISGIYSLQGVAIGMDANKSQLQQLNGSVLDLSAPPSASLTLEPIVVEQTLGTEGRVTDPYAPGQSIVTGSLATSGSRLTITSAENGTELKGFAIAGGDVLVLSLKDDETVGLVLGFRQND